MADPIRLHQWLGAQPEVPGVLPKEDPRVDAAVMVPGREVVLQSLQTGPVDLRVLGRPIQAQPAVGARPMQALPHARSGGLQSHLARSGSGALPQGHHRNPVKAGVWSAVALAQASEAGTIRAAPPPGVSTDSCPSSHRTRYRTPTSPSITSRISPSRGGVPTVSDSTRMRSPIFPDMTSLGVARPVRGDNPGDGPDYRRRRRPMTPPPRDWNTIRGAATLMPSLMNSSSSLRRAAIRERSRSSVGSTKVTPVPARPARAVRPTRWT